MLEGPKSPPYLITLKPSALEDGAIDVIGTAASTKLSLGLETNVEYFTISSFRSSKASWLGAESSWPT